MRTGLLKYKRPELADGSIHGALRGYIVSLSCFSTQSLNKLSNDGSVSSSRELLQENDFHWATIHWVLKFESQFI